jgi:hypothetical protein
MDGYLQTFQRLMLPPSEQKSKLCRNMKFWEQLMHAFPAYTILKAASSLQSAAKL